MKNLTILIMAICIMAQPVLSNSEGDSFKELLSAGQNKAAAERFNEARLDYARALSLAANDAQKAQTQLLIGLSYVAEGKFPQSRIEFNKVLKMAGANAFFKTQAQSFIALAYNSEGQNDQARKEYEKITTDKNATTDDKAAAQFGIALSYFDEKKYIEARREFEKHLRMPNLEAFTRSTSQFFVGRTYLEQRDFVKAREAFTKVFALRAGDTNPQFEAMNLQNQQRAQQEIAKSYVLEAQEQYSQLLKTKNLDPTIEAEARKALSALKSISEPDVASPTDSRSNTSTGKQKSK